MARKKSTEIIELSDTALEGSKLRLASGSLLEEDKSVLLAIVSTYVLCQDRFYTPVPDSIKNAPKYAPSCATTFSAFVWCMVV